MSRELVSVKSADINTGRWLRDMKGYLAEMGEAQDQGYIIGRGGIKIYLEPELPPDAEAFTMRLVLNGHPGDDVLNSLERAADAANVRLDITYFP